LLRLYWLFVVLAVASCAVPAVADEPASCTPPPDVAQFFRAVIGEWVGVCKQSTDNEAAEEKYFRATIKEVSPGSFQAHFDYFRTDCNGTLLQIGASEVTATLCGNGATGRIVGNGEVTVERKVRKQEHDITETMVSTASGLVTAKGSGSLKVAGMPLGLGKLGKVKDDQSTWSLSNGTLTVHQSMNVVFRALFVSKSFKVDASYTAVRGSDVSTLLSKKIPATAP